jgi:hypothetical protein
MIDPKGLTSDWRNLGATLSDYDLVFGKGDRNEAVCRARLNVILFTILAAKKKEEFGQYGRGKGANKRVSTETTLPTSPFTGALRPAYLTPGPTTIHQSCSGAGWIIVCGTVTTKVPRPIWLS